MKRIIFGGEFARIRSTTTGLKSVWDTRPGTLGVHLEATLSCTTQDRVFIRKKEKKRASYGCVYNMGYGYAPSTCLEKKIGYWNIQGCFRQRLAVNRYGIPTIGPWGCAWVPTVTTTEGSLAHCCGARPLPCRIFVILRHKAFKNGMPRTSLPCKNYLMSMKSYMMITAPTRR